MKLKIGDIVYLQKYDITYILHETNVLPAGFLEELFDGGTEGYFFMDATEDRFNFENAFKRPSNVKWLMEQDWLVDYDEYEQKPLVDLKALYVSLEESYDTGAKEFNAHDHEYKAKHHEKESAKFSKLRHKITSIEHLIAYKRGIIKFKFPSGYRDKDICEDHPQKNPGFFARLFGRKN